MLCISSMWHGCHIKFDKYILKHLCTFFRFNITLDSKSIIEMEGAYAINICTLQTGTGSV